ncbi:D-alanyl-D-alanine carboxypeptidase [Ruminococcus sp. zg-924]|nr:D-alanyl-D-alanine carboxypeptidase [Ruminococcus sp. zg-924]MCQ4115567.1 D-alanyl-D-alanine carboxypeptidase [Ruminococcus sp. zg-921]
MIFAISPSVAAEDEISVSAQAAALLCIDTGEFLFIKNGEERLPMASTTKIMTSLLALEAAQKNDKEVVFTKEMIAEGSSMGLKLGYKLALSDLAAGMMTVSGNDSANAAAIGVSGSYEKFAELMNKRAKALGLDNTSFVTPSGLDDENHYSTACDMAHLMEHAMSNKTFAELVGHKSVKVDFISPEDLCVTYTSHNRLLSLYEYCTGGKTGFTKKAGRCLVTAAERDGKHLVAVTLNAGDDWNDHIKMYDYGFSQLEAMHYDDTAYHKSVAVVGGVCEKISVGAYSSADCVVSCADKDKIKREVQLPHFLYAPVNSGNVVGRIVYKLNGKIIAENALVAEDNCAAYEEKKGILELIGDGIKKIFGIRD